MAFPNLLKKVNSRKKEPENIRKDVNYFVEGEDVVFKLINDLDFTFEKLYVFINDHGLFIKVPEEDSMNLINLLDTVHDGVGVNRKQVLDSDVADMILQLDPDLFNRFESEMMELTDVREIFELDLEGFRFLKELEHYYLIEYGTKTKRLDFHLGGKIGNAIRRKGVF